MVTAQPDHRARQGVPPMRTLAEFREVLAT